MTVLYPWQTDSWRSLLGLRNRLPHALLLKGAQGIGKFDLAMQFAQSLLCESPQEEDGFACQHCMSCHWFTNNAHPDFRLIQPEVLEQTEEISKKPSQEISVVKIRELSDFNNLSSHRGGYRIVLLHPAEAMNANSANALLKVLEEPTEKLLFILVTHKPQQLLPTILSRCISLAIQTPSVETGLAWLKEQGVTHPENMLSNSGFSPLRALQLAGVGEAMDEGYTTLVHAIRQPQQINPIVLAEQLQSTPPFQIIQCMQQWCHDLASFRLAGMVRYFPDQSDLIKKLSGHLSLTMLLRYQKDLLVAKREAFHPLNQKLLIESILIAYRQIFLAKG
jgi:DNA polymerase-3 subunit delta'